MKREQFYEACQSVMRHASGSYARSYARAGLSLRTLEEIRAQALHVLNHLQFWRGERARATKEVLRAFAKWEGEQC